ncbi:MAG: alpha/beta hydrolase [Actinomycetota bacterium]|nr:alpha/beta hydrolase [Actinomycetota bacterium]
MLLSRRRFTGLAALGAFSGVPGCSVAGTAPVPVPGTLDPVRIAYGPGPSQYGELHLPVAAARRRGVVVVLHGGFWQSGYGAELGTPLAVALANAGITAWNVEYRRIGNGGGWPATFEDVAAAVDALAGPAAEHAARAGAVVDLDRVVTLGHSAGGHLAAWLAGRAMLPAGAPGGPPRVRVRGVVSQAGVLDLVAADAAGLGGRSTSELLGGSVAEQPQRYRLASPAAMLPLGVPVTCVHGTADRNVPLTQSVEFARAARAAGDPGELVTLAGVDHFALIDPETEAWRRCQDAVMRLLGH